MTAKKNIKIAIGADHGGFDLKENLKIFLSEKGYQFSDCGTDSKESVDYPKFACAVANKIANGEVNFGIMVDGAGIGSAMAANKVKGVRAASCYNAQTAKNAREHNNANMLTLGGGLIEPGLARQIVEIFLTTDCTIDRHLRRVQMINELDNTAPPNKLLNDNSPTNKEKTLINISSADLARIAERVGELVVGSTESTKGPNCGTDMVCACGMCVERKPETIRRFLNSGVDRIGYHDGTGCECVPQDIAHCIDHTLLKPDTTEKDVIQLCNEAREYQFATVCISPGYVSLAAKQLAGSRVKVCTVVGFPSGAHLPEIKAMETRQAIREGAGEIDMVINIGALKSGNDDLVYRDIRMVCEACEDGGVISKVIIEAALLSDDEKLRACNLAKKARANFVKTSTGFGPHGATAEDVSLMSRVVQQAGIEVKAAGGIRNLESAQEMIAAGATRIGASAGIKILQEAKSLTVSN